MLLTSIKNYEDQVSQFNAARGSDRPPLVRQSRPDSENEREAAPMSENDMLREHLRPLEAGEQRIQGTFLKLDCDNKGVAYFSIQAGDRTYRIRSMVLDRVQLTAYTPSAANISCGPRKAPENVVITFRPTADPKDTKAKVDGDAVAVELMPKDFTLKN
jgi:hypothetical protein